MSESLKFSIDGLEIVEAANKSQFAKAKVDFFVSGNNLHNMPVKEENLRKYANTILGKPLVYVIEKGWFRKEDFGDHDSLEVPMGYFSEVGANIEFRETSDGRIIASAIAFIWKKYAKKAMEIFVRDNAKKPVSVEMQIINSVEDSEGRKEIVDFAFTCCTVLGDDVTPAVEDANIEIFEFSMAKKKYEEELKRYSSIDFSIPNYIKDNIKLFMERAKEKDINLLPTALSKSNYIIKNNFVSPEKIQGFVQFFQKHKDDNSFFLCGGEESKNWFNNLYKKIEIADQVEFSNTEIKEEKMVDNKEEVKDEKEKFATDANVEGEAALIRSEEETEGDKDTVEEEKKEVFAETKEEEAKEDPKEEKEETPEEEKAENAQMAVEMACLKAEMCDLKMNFTALQTNFANLENEAKELRDFKASVLATQRKAVIEFSLAEVSDVIPKERIEELREETSKYPSIDVWANAVKAEAFSYVKKTITPETFTRMALPNIEKKSDVKKSIWAD
jgi:hypothetical protein